MLRREFVRHSAAAAAASVAGIPLPGQAQALDDPSVKWSKRSISYSGRKPP